MTPHPRGRTDPRVSVKEKMKNFRELKKVICAEIAKIKADKRYHYPPATIEINAPLALIQLEMETKVTILEWVLKQIGDKE
jgi:hypothetical protein